MTKKFKLLFTALFLGWCMASVGYSQAEIASSNIPGSNSDPLVTQSYVDQTFTALESRINKLETRINNLPRNEVPNQSLEPNQVRILINGQAVNFPDQKPYIDVTSNRTLVPIRFIMETIEAQVDWSPTDKKVTIIKAENKIELWVNKTLAKVNGVEKTTDQPPVILNSRTMVPLRFFGQNLGYTVDWDPQSRQALIQIP